MAMRTRCSNTTGASSPSAASILRWARATSISSKATAIPSPSRAAKATSASPASSTSAASLPRSISAKARCSPCRDMAFRDKLAPGPSASAVMAPGSGGSTEFCDRQSLGGRKHGRRHPEPGEEIIRLTKYLDRLPKAMSGGQRQRVAIGRAIVRNPKVFLFDEPLSNLDAALRVATRIEIAKLKESMPNTTMIYVTHDQVEAMTLADRIVVLKEGYVEQVGTPMELYKRPGNLFVAQFIGSPAMNILPAKIEK